MSTFLERLIEEKEQLSERLEKLRAFIASEKFQEIDPVQMTLLNIQVKAMETYSQCLLERIVRLQ
jgi:cell division septum initiation protein DivIVA